MNQGADPKDLDRDPYAYTMHPCLKSCRAVSGCIYKYKVEHVLKHSDVLPLKGGVPTRPARLSDPLPFDDHNYEPRPVLVLADHHDL